MCFFGSPQRTAPPKPEFKDSPPVVTGMQTGVKNPKDTVKATEQLKIKRQKREGTYVDSNSSTDPNLSAVKENLTRGGRGNKTAQQKKNLAANRAKAQSMAKARLTKKKSFSNKVSGR